MSFIEIDLIPDAFPDMFSGSTTLIFSTTDPTRLTYEDFDKDLEPYTYYEYSVTGYNGAGSVRSYWAKELSAQTAPEHVPAPVVQVGVRE